ncbi:MAG: hypothetical protein ACJ754_27715 [Pyrinomonadaceae bacterium]
MVAKAKKGSGKVGQQAAKKAAKKGGQESGPTLSPNFLLVNIIPQSLSFEHNNDSEPNLAVNPANPKQMAASAFTPNPGLHGNAPIFVSKDGGLTWVLNAIVPSDRITADISLRFGGTSNNLYAGILHTPMEFDVEGRPVPRLNILRTNDFLGSAPMTVLVNRKGNAGVDQPYIQAIAAGGTGAGKDIVVCGSNDANQPDGRTATMDFSGDGGGPASSFKSVDIDARVPAGGQDAPSIRPAIHQDGTVYGAFLHQVGGTTLANLRYDLIVVRDDNFGSGPTPFVALTDPSDGRPGRRAVQNRLIPFLNEHALGQERIGSNLTIAVDPRPGHSDTVYIAWADMVGTNQYTLHVRRSTDRGVTWSSNDLLTIPNATNPALAINSNGKIGFLFQHLSGVVKLRKVIPSNRWETHLRRSTDGINWDDLVMATVPANNPMAGPNELPYLGDYLHLLTVGKDFYGIFTASNIPDPANFPNGVIFQRNHSTKAPFKLFDVDGTTEVEVSLDPFFFKVTE